MTPAALRRIRDPIARAKAAMKELEAVEALRAEYLALRDEAVVEAAAVHPWSYSDVAEEVGISKQRVAQIVKEAKGR